MVQPRLALVVALWQAAAETTFNWLPNAPQLPHGNAGRCVDRARWVVPSGAGTAGRQRWQDGMHRLSEQSSADYTDATGGSTRGKCKRRLHAHLADVI